MAIRPILTEGHPMLRQQAKKVRRLDASLRRLVDDMFDTMHDADGLGLAAPQVGVPLAAHRDRARRRALRPVQPGDYPAAGHGH